MMKNKKYYIKIIIIFISQTFPNMIKNNYYFHFPNIPKYAQLNLFEVGGVFVCLEVVFSFGAMLI